MFVLGKFFGFLFVGYLFTAFIFYLAQRVILYRPDISKPNLDAANVSDMQLVNLHTKDGLSLNSWFKEPEQGKHTIIYFHGNAGNIGTRGPSMRPLLDAGLGLLLVEYRGYGGNPGFPTEQGLYFDARAGFSFLKENNIKEKDIIIFGESLGTGVATQMALEYKTKLLILQSPYTSMKEIGGMKFPIFPVGFLLKDRFDSISKIAKITQKLFLFHGEKDIVVPVSLGKKLFAAARGEKEIYLIPEAAHANIMTLHMAKKIISVISTY